MTLFSYIDEQCRVSENQSAGWFPHTSEQAQLVNCSATAKGQREGLGMESGVGGLPPANSSLLCMQIDVHSPYTPSVPK